MQRETPRSQIARSFLAALILTLGTSTFLGAASPQSSDPCRCTYDRGSATYPNLPPPQCFPLGGMITVLNWVPNSAVDGQCTLPGCTERHCSGQGSLTVIADSACPMTIYRDGTPVARGMSIVTLWFKDDLECGDFVDYSVEEEGVCIVHLTDICWACGSGH
jgi:hypothetical protein